MHAPSCTRVSADHRGRQLYYRRLDRLEAHPLPETDNASTPFFSPDGRTVAFTQGTVLQAVVAIEAVIPRLFDTHCGKRSDDRTATISLRVAQQLRRERRQKALCHVPFA